MWECSVFCGGVTMTLLVKFPSANTQKLFPPMQSLCSQSVFFRNVFLKVFFKVYSGLCPSGGTSKCIFQSMYIFHKYLFQKFIFPKCIFLQIHFFRVYSGPCPCGGTITLLVTSLISFGKCNLEKIQFSENFLEIPGNINVTAMYDNSLLATIYKDLPGNYLYQCQ